MHAPFNDRMRSWFASPLWLALILFVVQDSSIAAQTARAAAERAYGEGVALMTVHGDLAGAYKKFQTAARHDPTHAPSVFNAGYLASSLGDSVAAKRWWLDFLKLDSTSIFAVRARKYLRSQEAMSYPDSAASYEDLVARARSRFVRGEFEAAYNELRSAYQLDPQRWEAPAALARVFEATNRPDQAAASLVLAWSTAPPDVRATIRQALYQLQSRRNLPK